MAVARIRQQLYTPEEYLALEEAADHRSEYYQGQTVLTLQSIKLDIPVQELYHQVDWFAA